MIGQNLLTHKNTLSKWKVNAFYCVNGLHAGLCILCVKMRTLLCGESTVAAKQSCNLTFLAHSTRIWVFLNLQVFRIKRYPELPSTRIWIHDVIQNLVDLSAGYNGYARVDDGRVRKENVAGFEVSGDVWTGP